MAAEDRPPEGEAPGPLLISACLIGEACRYDGRHALAPAVKALLDRGEAVACCPEELGGLGTPRPPAELVGGSGEDVLAGRARVMTAAGDDVTKAYLQGARETLAVAQELGACGAILKARSPSCGVYAVYDGSFSGTRVAGEGVTAALLRRHGIPVFSEEDVETQGLEQVMAAMRGTDAQQTLTVRLFAAARETAGQERLEVAWTPGAPVAALRQRVMEAEPGLAALMPHLMVAVNGRSAGEDESLSLDDEVALLPPVSGGTALPDTVTWRVSVAGDRFGLSGEPFAVEPLLRFVDDGAAGALVSFVGSVRSRTAERRTLHLEYEAYEEMAFARMEALAGRARRRWPVCGLVMVHRVGLLQPNEWAVAVVVSTPHRGEAFAVGRFLIDALKVELPVWKKELGPDGETWVGLGG